MGDLARRAADSDEHLIALWLHSKAPNTQLGYVRNAAAFMAFAGKSLHECGLDDAQRFADQLDTQDLSDGSKHFALSAVKSLFAFAKEIGYLQLDATRVLKLPAFRETLNERILEEDEVQRLIDAGANERNRLILQVLYVTGMRREELVSLRWRDCRQRPGGGQLTVFGKGRKTRTIGVPANVWAALIALRSGGGPDDPVFVSRRGGALDASMIWRIVAAAAKKAGLDQKVSPHWMRHCHCSHALDHGAPIHLVQKTAGHSSISTTSRYLHVRPNQSSADFLKDSTPAPRATNQPAAD